MNKVHSKLLREVQNCRVKKTVFCFLIYSVANLVQSLRFSTGVTFCSLSFLTLLILLYQNQNSVSHLSDRRQFCVSLNSHLKSKVGNILVKSVALCINLNIDGTLITSRSHTHPGLTLSGSEVFISLSFRVKSLVSHNTDTSSDVFPLSLVLSFVIKSLFFFPPKNVKTPCRLSFLSRTPYVCVPFPYLSIYL